MERITSRRCVYRSVQRQRRTELSSDATSTDEPVLLLMSKVFFSQIHANCRIRRVYFSDRLYSEDELPAEFKLYLPVQNQKAKVRHAPPHAVRYLCLWYNDRNLKFV